MCGYPLLVAASTGKVLADFSIPELVAGIFGPKAWMTELGRKGGKVTSNTKATATRKNESRGQPKKNAVHQPS